MTPRTSDGQKLMLHTCCADCLLKAFVGLEEKGIAQSNIVLFFANSNIHPRTEWLARLDAVKQIANDKKLELIVGDWSPQQWFEAIGKERTQPNRCHKCWKFRLTETWHKAQALGINKFSTTLLSSHYQDRQKLIEIGQQISENGFAEFQQPCNCKTDTPTKGFYKQNYCGCCYSLVERFEEKWPSTK